MVKINNYKILSKTKQSKNIKRIFGYDIETYSSKNKFYCASLYDYQNPSLSKTLFSPGEVILELKNKKYRNSFIVATNLLFDFFGTFDNEECQHYKTLFRDSNLLYAKYMKSKNRSGHIFIDTLNYAQIGVEKAGKILNILKLDHPSFLGRLPKNIKEKEEMIKYNMRDSEVSAKFFKFLIDGFIKMGASPKLTIASTSMSLFTNKYIKDSYFRHDIKILDKLFEGYYGGRVEAFKRGKIDNKYKYYDFNSLYPTVMCNTYPNPNSLRHSNKNSINSILNYEGLSLVKVKTPNPDKLKYPLLPFRYDNKLMFSCGEFTSWQSHIELRKAIKLGYDIKKVYESYYYKEQCKPFKEMITKLYNIRKKYKSQNNSMEYVVKILMNSHYGKYGSKFRDKDNILPVGAVEFKDIDNAMDLELLGNDNFVRIKKDIIPPKYCIPIWAIYTTSNARLMLYDSIVKHKAIYCDTDSIITKNTIENSKELGGLKLEMDIDSGIIVKPKFYMVKGTDEKGNKNVVMAKCKGVRFSGSNKEKLFKELVNNRQISYNKFVKFKESLRYLGHNVNEIIHQLKTIKFSDDKRNWDNLNFDKNKLQDSKPVILKL